VSPSPKYTEPQASGLIYRYLQLDGSKQVRQTSSKFILPAHSTSAHRPKVIDTLTGQKTLAHTAPFTYGVTAYRVLGHEKYGSKLVFVHIVGFDGTYKGDKEVLEAISGWMVHTYVRSFVHSTQT